MINNLKIDTSLLKQLVTELDNLLLASQKLKEQAHDDQISLGKFIIEVQKASGLAAGIALEATALVTDCNYEVRAIQSPGGDSLEKILGLKGSSGGYGGSGSSFN